jgi:dTMP kinase
MDPFMPLITFEGIEGSGKSTQARLFSASISGEALLTFEPGATPLGARLREILLDRGGSLTDDAELMLFLADRAQHVGAVIAPALAAGRTVVCDRFVDSTLAYQGYGRGLSLDRIRALHRALLGDLRPDLTVLLDVTVATGLARVGRRGAGDRIESERQAFHERVRGGYLEMAAQQPERWVVIDAEADPEVVAMAVRAAVQRRDGVKHAVR